MIQPKVIIVGGGVSGLTTAIKAVEKGALVELFSLLPTRRSPSVCVQGGINAALNTKGEGDSVDEHAIDTSVCGAFLAHESAVTRMCRAAPQVVSILDRMGVAFHRTAEGLFDLRRLAGQTKRRAAFVDSTIGQHVLYAMDEQVRRMAGSGKVKKYEGWELMSFVLDSSGTCRGITAMNLTSMETRAFVADAVILATGDFSNLFSKSTAGIHCTGNAAAQGYKQGALFSNAEFVQFYPTTLLGRDKMRPITDAVFGEGARLWVPRDEKPWYFLEEWYPTSWHFVSRSVLSRAIWKVVKEMGLGIDGEDAVYLDLTALDPRHLFERLGGVVDLCQKFAGTDPTKVPVKVFPAAHATLGGLWGDDRHMTSIPGLFAVGRCLAAYHGADLLSGNELLADIYSGMVAGPASVEYIATLSRTAVDIPSSLLEDERQEQDILNRKFLEMNGYENPHKLKHELGNVLSEHAFLVRDNAGLKKADESILALRDRFFHCGIPDKGMWANGELSFMRGLANQFELARLVVLGALGRNESRGTHFKPAFPHRDDANWQCLTKASYDEEEPRFDYSERPVVDHVLQERGEAADGRNDSCENPASR